MKKNVFPKTTAGNRAPPKYNLLTSFITSIAITFYTLIRFNDVGSAYVLISNIIDFKMCFCIKVAAPFASA